MRKVVTVFMIFSFILSSAPGVQALILPQLTLGEMISRSNTIVSGKCTSFHIHPSENGDTLYAIISFQVEEYLKNNLGKKEIFLMQIAREKGPDGKQTAGPLSFKIDEESLLFLTEEDIQGFRHVMGLSQGKFPVTTDPKGHKLVLRQNPDALLYNRITGKIAQARKFSQKFRYELFKEFVKEALSKIEANKREFILIPPATSF